MLGVVFLRRLREGKTYEDFRAAWYPDVGFGVPARIVSGPGVTDDREIVTIGFVTFFLVEGDHDFSAAPATLAEERRGFPWG